MAGVCKINTEFVKWKALYLLSGASQGPYVFFLANFYITRGLSYQEVGFIESIVPFLGCIFRPLTCYFADRFALHRCLLTISGLIYAASLFGFVILSTRYELIVPSNVDPPNNDNNFTNLTSSANFTPGNNSENSTFVVQKFVLPVMCGLRFLSTVGITPATSLLDGIIYHALESSGQSANWGRQRLWGSIGFSVAALCSAFLLDMFSTINYVIGFSLALGFAVIFVIISLTSVTSYETVNVKNKKPSEAELDKSLMLSNSDEVKPEKNHFLSVAAFIFRDGHVILVLVVAGAVGYLTACRDIFISQYIESITKTNSKKIMGVMQAIVGSLEIPVMFTAGWFFNKIGTMPFFAACFAAYALRFWFYTLLTADVIWLFLVIELLHLFCFGLPVPAFTLHAHRRTVKSSLPEMSTIMQGLVSALYLGLGYGIGSIAGGVVTQRIGGVNCMLVFSLTGAGCFVIFGIVWLIITVVSRRRQKNSNTNDDLPTSSQQQNRGGIAEKA